MALLARRALGGVSAVRRAVTAPALKAFASTTPSSQSATSPAAPSQKGFQVPDYLLSFTKSSTQRSLYHVTSYFLAAALPASFLVGGFVTTLADIGLGLAIPLHFHMGMRSVLLDYVHDEDQLKAALVLLALVTGVTAVGLLKFNTMDIGMTEGLRQLFVAQKEPPKQMH